MPIDTPEILDFSNVGADTKPIDLESLKLPEQKAVNINQNITGNFEQGPMPGAKKGTMDFAKSAVNYLSQAGQWANDPLKYGRTYDYGAGYQNYNFDRYYNKKLGFSPYRDNETIYNENTGWASDLTRAFVPTMKLLGTGFISPFTSGQWASENMAKQMAQGNSTRGGAFQAINNFGLNAAFTVGIAAELAAETAAMVAVDTYTGGAAIPATALEWGNRIKSSFNLLKGLGTTAKAFGVTRDLVGAAKGLDTIEQTRNFWNLSNAGKNVANFLNPLEHTSKLLKDIKGGVNGVSGWQTMSDFAKLKTGVGAFYRDFRMINLATHEALMEGASTNKSTNERLINEFYATHGYMPTGKDAKDIYDHSQAAGFWDTAINIPIIGYTNKIVFEKLFNPFNYEVAAKSFVEGSTRKLVQNKAWKIGENAFEFGNKTWKDKLAYSFLHSEKNPLSMKYFAGNVGEGLQENAQDIISQAAENYYSKVQQDPTNASFMNGIGEVGKSIKGQFSSQGANTFFSGLFMGSVVQGLGSGITGIYHKAAGIKTDPVQQQRKEEYENNLLNALNATLKDPISVLNANKDNAAVMRNLGLGIDAAQEAADQKSYHDLIADMKFQQLRILSKTGKLGLAKDYIKSQLTMNDDELSNAYNVKPSQAKEIRKNLGEFNETIDKFKDTYDKIENRFGNPFDPYKIDPKKDPEGYKKMMDNYQGYEMAKSHVLFAHMHFADINDRMTKIYDGFISNKALANTPATDFSILLDNNYREGTIVNGQDGISKIAGEEDVLREEIKSLKSSTDAKDKTLAVHKQKKLDALTNYSSALSVLKGELRAKQNAKFNSKTRATQEQISTIQTGDVVKHKDGRKLTITRTSGKYAYYIDKATGKERRVERKSLVLHTKGKNHTDLFDADRGISEAVIDLREAYGDYLRLLAEHNGGHLFESDVEKSFKALLDYHMLNHDASGMVKTINVLHDGNHFMDHARRMAEINKKRFESIQKDLQISLDAFLKMRDTNTLLNSLYDLGVFIEEDSVNSLLTKHTMQGVIFYDITSKEPVTKDDPKYNKILDAIRVYEKATGVSILPKEEVVPETPGTPGEPVVPGEVIVTPPSVSTELEKITLATPLSAMPDELVKRIITFIRADKSLDPRLLKLSDAELVLDPAFQDIVSHSILLKFSVINKYNSETGRTGEPPVQEPPPTKGFTPEDVHKAAKEAGVDYNSKDFMNQSFEITGKEYLDDMNSNELEQMIKYLKNPKEPISDIETKRADIERRRQEELNQQTGDGYSTIALDYLFTGGRDVMLSTDYLLQALVGGFTNATTEINNIRNKYADKLGNIKDDINSDVYNQMMNEIRDVINKNYNNSKATEIFDKILKNATGFTSREGNQTSIELDKLNEQNESKINAKYDAELAALEPQYTRVTKPEFRGKIIYATPGSGKTFLTSLANNIVDVDDLILKGIQEMFKNEEAAKQAGIILPEELRKFTAMTKEDMNADRSNPLSIYQFAAAARSTDLGTSIEDSIYMNVLKQMQAEAKAGKTVLTGSLRLMQDVDIVILADNEGVGKRLGELKDKFKARELEILKISPKSTIELEGTLENLLTDSTVPEPISDIEAKKADIERRRQEELFNILSNEDKQTALKIPEGEKRNKWIKRQAEKVSAVVEKGKIIQQSGNDIIERHNAEDAVNDKTKSLEERITAQLNIDNDSPFNEGTISGVTRGLKDIEEGRVNATLSTIRAAKRKIEEHDAELDALEGKKAVDYLGAQETDPIDFITNRLSDVHSTVELKEAEKELLDWWTDTQSKLTDGITWPEVQAMLDNRKENLVLTFDFKDLGEGDVVVMQSKTKTNRDIYKFVKKVTKTEVRLTPFSIKDNEEKTGANITLLKSQVKDEKIGIAMKYRRGIEDMNFEPEVVPDDKEIINTGVDDSDVLVEIDPLYIEASLNKSEDEMYDELDETEEC